MAALDKIFELLDVAPELTDRPDAYQLGRIRGEIRFEDVSFSYQAPGNGIELSAVERWGSRDLPPLNGSRPVEFLCVSTFKSLCRCLPNSGVGASYLP